MNRVLLPLAALIVQLLPATAEAGVINAGNFHLRRGSVGCRWQEYGPRTLGSPAAFSLRCERYADRTFVTITRGGDVRMSRTGRWVRPGKAVKRAGWSRLWTRVPHTVFCDVQKRFDVDVDADRWRPVLGCTVFRDPQQSFALGAAVKERRP